MARVRVVSRADGGVSVIHPAEDLDLWHYRRVCRQAMNADPTLTDRPFTDLDHTELPARSEACGDCDGEHSTRHLWTLDDGRVQPDRARPNLHAHLDHVNAAHAAEMDQDEPDFHRVNRLDHARHRLARALRGETDEAAAVERAASLIDHRSAPPGRLEPDRAGLTPHP